MKLRFCIPSLLGVEGLIADELRFLEAEDVAAENGRVLFSGDETTLAPTSRSAYRSWSVLFTPRRSKNCSRARAA